MNPIILALDFPTLEQADAMLAKVREHIGMIKVGLEMFTANGWEAAQLAKQYELPVFLDLKLYDIPTTVAKTTSVVCERLSSIKGNNFLSVHCMGGAAMCRAALEASNGANTKVTGITLLTSFNYRDLRELGYSDTRTNIQTVGFARLGRHCSGRDNGLTHFVCAPQNVPLMRKHFGQDITIITPGIRPDDGNKDDHKNSMTAAQALKGGSNWLVIGRPITQAVDPVVAAQSFAEVARVFAPGNNAI